ncbi:DUF2938 family protein [Novosphingobium sp. BW1]|uniref:DUF2938 family protein n=1 Tax=Novosphingobium sp. BW1 TaxID=2592621 RepID=UPI001396ABFA
MEPALTCTLIVGLLYAAAYPLVWGGYFLTSPTPDPFILVGIGLSTLAGLCVLTPAMGRGMFASRTPDQRRPIRSCCSTSLSLPVCNMCLHWGW